VRELQSSPLMQRLIRFPRHFSGFS